MSSTRLIGGFVLRFLIVFVPLMVSWPAVREPYGALFRRAGNVLVGLGSERVGVGSQRAVWFNSCDDPNPDRDVEIVFTDPDRTRRAIRIGSRLDGYMPTVFVLALIVAAPIPWRRRSRALLWGFVVVNAYVALIIMSFPLKYGSGGSLGAVIGEETVRKTIDFFYWIIAGSATGWMLIPLCIAALVTLRRTDFPGMLQEREDQDLER